MEVDHDFFEDAGFFPTGADAFGGNGADAGDFGKALGFVLDHAQRVDAKVIDEKFRFFRADAFDHRSEIAADAFDCFGQIAFVVSDLELFSVAVVIGPMAVTEDFFAELDRCKLSDNHDGIVVSFGLKGQDRIAVLLVVVDDTMHRTAQALLELQREGILGRRHF